MNFPLREAQELVKDLQRPDPRIYWADLIVSASFGWTCFFQMLAAHDFSIAQFSFYFLTVISLYRAVIFIHEIAHFKRSEFGFFRFIWNLILGIPFMAPSFMYEGVHNEHHKTAIYGGKGDGEYVPFVTEGRLAIVISCIAPIFLPAIFALRFIVLTPLSFIHPRLRKLLWEKASSLVLDLVYSRPAPTKAYGNAWRFQELGAFLFGSTILYLVHNGTLPIRLVIGWYCIEASIFFVNNLRTLAAHCYRNGSGAAMDRVDQYLDSVNIPGNPLVTPLWAPVGLRFHATHHLFPTIPYHSLGEAHRRLLSQLPENPVYKKTLRKSLAHALGRLWKEARPILILMLLCINAAALPPEVPKRPKAFPPEGRVPKEIKRNPLDFLFRFLKMKTPVGPLLFIPLVDTNKDIGMRTGMMPILALRDKKGDGIAAVVAPSIRYNRFLKTEYTWRTYWFPNETELIVVRGAYSQVVNREIFLRYFTREFMGTKYRLNAEFHLNREGKFSFNGIGPDSLDQDRSNFSKYKIGEEISGAIPLAENFYLELNHSMFQYQLGEGPITTLKRLSTQFPSDAILGWKRFVDHGIALTYDSTDHQSLPTKGGLATLSAGSAQRVLGSDYTFQHYGTQLKGYYNIKKGKYVTAAHFQFQQQQGDTIPFYAQNVVGESSGLRLVGDGRYVDRGRMVLSIEERIRVARSPLLAFFSEVEITPCLDVGTVFPHPGKLRFDNLQPGPGIAARILLRPQVVITLDLTWLGDRNNFILKVDYPF